ncbi:MAG: hypothetical protein ACTSWQ_00945 [Candidatus Thorarchaeota archaeon]
MEHRDWSGEIRENIKNYIIANYETYIDGIQAYYNDDIKLPMIEDNDIYMWKVPVDDYQHYPFISIATELNEYEFLTTGTDAIQSTISLWFILKGWDEDEQQEMRTRYESAFRNMVAADYSLGNTVGEARIEAAEHYGAIGGEQETTGVKIRLIVLTEIPR